MEPSISSTVIPILFSELFSMPSLQSLQLHVQRRLLGASSDLCVRISHVEWIKDVDDLIVIIELACLPHMPWSSSDRPQLARYEKEELSAIQHITIQCHELIEDDKIDKTLNSAH